MVLPVITLVAVGYAQTLLVTRSSLLDEMGGRLSDDRPGEGAAGRSGTPPACRPQRAAAHRHHGLHQPRPCGGRVDPGRDGLLLAGPGRTVLPGLSVPDLPLVQGLFVVFAGAMILMNLLADLLYPLLDPRVGR